MTLHDEALKWVAGKVMGKVTHSYGSHSIHSFEGRTPDVIEPEKAIHEVEAIHMNASRIISYSKIGLRKVLWLIFDTDPFLGFDEVNVIHRTKAAFATTFQINPAEEAIRSEVAQLTLTKEALITEIDNLKKQYQFYLEARPKKGNVIIRKVSPEAFFRIG